MTKLSVSLPTDLLHLARNAGLIDAHTSVSALLAALLKDAVDQRDAAVGTGVSATDEAGISEAMLRASAEIFAEELDADGNDYIEWKARRVRAAG